MATINQLAQATTVTDGDLLVGYQQVNGDTRSIPLSVVWAYILTKISAGTSVIKQYFAPTATGFNVTLNAQPTGTPVGSNAWLVLTPAAGYAAGTITLPQSIYCLDQQEIIVSSSQAVTALTVAPNGAQLVGAPTTIAAGGFFRLRFDIVTQTWYRVG